MAAKKSSKKPKSSSPQPPLSEENLESIEIEEVHGQLDVDLLVKLSKKMDRSLKDYLKEHDCGEPDHDVERVLSFLITTIAYTSHLAQRLDIEPEVFEKLCGDIYFDVLPEDEQTTIISASLDKTLN